MPKDVICDVCGKPTKRVVVKLFKVPKDGERQEIVDYNAHANVGVCCVLKVNEIKWRPRRQFKRRKSEAQPT